MAQAKCRNCGLKHEILYQWGVSMYFKCPTTGKLEWNGKGVPDVEGGTHENTLRSIHALPTFSTVGGVQGDLYSPKW